MSDQTLGFVVDPDVPPAPAAPVEPPSAQAPIKATQEPPPQAPPEEEDHPDAVEVQPGVKMVPLSALHGVREELKALKPVAQKAQQLEQQVAQFAPYVQFLQAHPELLTPTQPQPATPQAPAPQDDPALVELARTLDLYTADAKPDTVRAAKIRDLTRAEAQTVAQQTVQPIQEGAWEQGAAHNLTWMINQKDAFGRPLEESYVIESVRSIYGSLPRGEALRVLADKRVAELITDIAVSRQSRGKAYTAPPQAPTAPALHVESAGGATPVNVSEDHTKRLGVSHDKYVAAANRYQPGKSNVLE